MTRKVKIGTTNVELSKNEAKEVSRIMLFKGNDKQLQFETWRNAATTNESAARRNAAGVALGLKT